MILEARNASLGELKLAPRLQGGRRPRVRGGLDRKRDPRHSTRPLPPFSSQSSLALSPENGGRAHERSPEVRLRALRRRRRRPVFRRHFSLAPSVDCQADTTHSCRGRRGLEEERAGGGEGGGRAGLSEENLSRPLSPSLARSLSLSRPLPSADPEPQVARQGISGRQQRALCGE